MILQVEKQQQVPFSTHQTTCDIPSNIYILKNFFNPTKPQTTCVNTPTLTFQKLFQLHKRQTSFHTSPTYTFSKTFSTPPNHKQHVSTHQHVFLKKNKIIKTFLRASAPVHPAIEKRILKTF
jgi:hypothetical protein